MHLVVVFCIIGLYSVLVVYECLRGMSCLHSQGQLNPEVEGT